MGTTFSVCIPNYNYEKYLPLTIESVLKQLYPANEIVIVDNASDDASLAIIETFAKKNNQIVYKKNPINIGFAGNLDAVGNMATSKWMIMLSSDDLMEEHALEVYQQFINLVPKDEAFSFCSAFTKINSTGNALEPLGAKQSSLWKEKDIDPKLSNVLGFDVYKVNSGEMLNRCLSAFYNPFNFASTCYQKTIYTSIGGYGGGRLYNPDKWFHWKLLSHCDFVYYLDSPLFKYRWHEQNQQNQQSQTGILKYWLDEYRNCFETDGAMLQKSHMTRSELERHFMNHLLKAAARELLAGQKQMCKRLINAAKAFYPNQYKNNKYSFKIKLLLIAYPFRGIINKLIRN